MSVFSQKTNYDTKIIETEKKISDHNYDKNITTLEFNNLAAGVVTARLAQVRLVTKTDFDTKLISFNEKINFEKPESFTCWKWIKKTTNIWFNLF